MRKEEKNMLKRFIRYYEPHKKMLTLDMLASLLISVSGQYHRKKLLESFDFEGIG